MAPLAERMRPQTLDEYIGQRHLVGEGAVIQRMIAQKRISSFILWGPPGVGKTTLANIIAKTLEVPFYTLSAVTSGVKDVREVIERARTNSGLFSKGTPILFIDEIHRFSKSQQDSLLGAVEKGIVTLIGATTENPSFEVIRPLLSRCQVYVLKSLDKDDLLALLDRALTHDRELKKKHITLKETGALLRLSGGDARKLLNILELVVEAASTKQNIATNTDSDSPSPSDNNTTDTESEEELVITDELVNESVLQNPLAYDKDGEMHYDVISAFIKSIRGSDPDAAIYYLARMIAAGEDPLFIARRLVISASEDIGLANPNALLLANACFDAVSKIGMPEGRIPLAEATVYLATSPKSNSSYLAIDSALAYVRQTGNLQVPLPLRNAPTSLMKELGYHDGYLYAHDYPDHFVNMQFLPDEAKDARFWHPQPHTPSEAKMLDRMLKCWGKRFEE
jgi:putative ATPase